MKRTDLDAFFEKAQKAGKKVSLTYYSAAGKCTFFVRNLDANGKPIQSKHPVTGAVRMFKGKPIYDENSVTFDPIVLVRSSKADALCFKTVSSDENGLFTASDKELIAVLEEMADDESSQIRREGKYKQDKNPEAFAREEELKKLKEEHGEKIAAAKEAGKAEALAEVESEMSKLQKQLAAAEKEISDLTDPDAELGKKPHKPGK